ncbi:PAS domain-containing hybrid sensor histidine kinase/response regulator [Rhizobium ruizarguesonis]|uniref:histidine kinase n=1 Tax=Rhizobium ruizarguesonis TaxID=2081791 RepID=A0AB38HZN5_9HYPH|nr:PAS domain-containing hybrid sensor histidine kinase/response regulator [Rhizobium ruizarguesonis]NEI09383.1 response regulator [Rhizobium ruizarguesonis]NEI31403.1 response regulator [Rhizobium ruizarguesonis]TAZ78739.1 PAS domain-containing hybrid sensor histidine kinase/response regulator [Rhizobium ruizarguesonis]TBA05112.1 PAS domain-containing hybrid sensor histidine kinase/response regulator [Rhizobium ruizarguesonis]TBA26546.1 PAS domain-containing hybrid sensor histidine kinase/res
MAGIAAIPNSGKPKALIYTPAGRDSWVARSLVDEAGLASIAATDLPMFASSLSDDIALGVLTEEAVRSSDLKSIAAWVSTQPSWSDLPFIVLTTRGGGPERNPAAARLSEVLGNVTFLERPFHATSFISVARAALKGRLRQYEAQARLEALGEGERRLQTALAAGRLGAWELELSSMALSASATCKAIFGRGPDDDVTRDDLIASIHPDDRPLVLARLRQTVDTGRDYSIEHRTIWPDGSLHWTEVHAQLYSDRYGSARKLVGVCSDTTVRKTIEENLRRLNENLEERVRERTKAVNAAHQTLLEEVAQRERAEEQLRQSQKMEAIGQLTGGVAHDFNNLLMVVLGNLELLGKHVGGDAKATRLVDGAIQGARRGAALTQRLLAFARQQDLQVKPVDLAELVSGMNDLLRRSVGSSISIETILPATLPPALVDANQLELALLNLAVNARDAMPDGGTLSISLREEQVAGNDALGKGAYLVLAVADGGTGMDAETLKKAVDPFFSTKELGKGTGLGLSMIHGLAVQLNGALRLTSELGVGTTAELWLPATERRPERPAEAELPVPQAASRLKILLVDDDALIAMSSVDMLEDLGHEVVEANSGSQALELISGQHFDLVITDYSMPGMTGAQLAQAARNIHPALPIVLATGYADLPAGTDIDLPRLAKPYDQAQLAKEIAKAMAGETVPLLRSGNGAGGLGPTAPPVFSDAQRML